MFQVARYPSSMSDSHPLRRASTDEIAEMLSFALRYDGRRRVHDADHTMARITADRLVRHLRQSGFVLMKAPAAAAPTTSGTPSPAGNQPDDKPAHVEV